MNYTFRQLAIAAFSAGTCLTTLAAQAQDFHTTDYYSQGVDAYFAGRSCQAESFLSTAIEFNSQDPRAYYFRAFSLLRQGRVDEARGDMLTGALLETKQPRRFAIGSALERIQGCDRLMLEEFRRSARRDAAMVVTTSGTQSATSRPAATFAPTTPNNAIIREGEANVLREQRVVPLEELLRPGGPNSVAVEPAAAPPAVPPQDSQPAGKAAQQPAGGQSAATPEPAVNDPFADDSGGATEPATPAPATPPQETPPAAPESTPPTAPPADPGENPFG
jgi:hypothetical protein